MNARELLNATVIYCLVAAVVVPGGSLVRAMKKKGENRAETEHTLQMDKSISTSRITALTTSSISKVIEPTATLTASISTPSISTPTIKPSNTLIQTAELTSMQSVMPTLNATTTMTTVRYTTNLTAATTELPVQNGREQVVVIAAVCTVVGVLVLIVAVTLVIIFYKVATMHRKIKNSRGQNMLDQTLDNSTYGNQGHTDKVTPNEHIYHVLEGQHSRHISGHHVYETISVDTGEESNSGTSHSIISSTHSTPPRANDRILPKADNKTMHDRSSLRHEYETLTRFSNPRYKLSNYDHLEAGITYADGGSVSARSSVINDNKRFSFLPDNPQYDRLEENKLGKLDGKPAANYSTLDDTVHGYEVLRPHMTCAESAESTAALHTTGNEHYSHLKHP